MDNAGLPQASEEATLSSELLSEFSSAPVEDIPEAVREVPELPTRSWLSRGVWRWGIGGVGMVALVSLPFLFWPRSPQSPPSTVQANSLPARSNSATSEAERTTSESDPSDSDPSDPNTSNSDPSGSNTSDASNPLLRHFPYEEAPQSELVPLTDDGSLTLRQPAAEKFLDMMAAAKADGVELVPLSGFRSIEEQEGVFFDVKAERGQQATKRAEVSAPPGYSEHHTGYAIDIGDGYFPDADLKESFENTPAFVWLQANAGYYSFELSFPQDNPQGVSYEPWHWRFVGDRDSLETFYQVRDSRSQPESQPGTQPESGETDEQE